jgi:hypothetical protein
VYIRTRPARDVKDRSPVNSPQRTAAGSYRILTLRTYAWPCRRNVDEMETLRGIAGDTVEICRRVTAETHGRELTQCASYCF